MDGAKLKKYLDDKKANKTALAKDLGMSKQNLYQLFESKTLEAQTRKKLEKELGVNWKNIDSVNIDGGNNQGEDQTDNITINKTVLKSLEDLSYSSRTNADSMKVMAENDRDKTRSIELLVKIIAVNSGVLPKEVLTQLADRTVPDAPSVEVFYGTDLSTQKAGKS